MDSVVNEALKEQVLTVSSSLTLHYPGSTSDPLLFLQHLFETPVIAAINKALSVAQSSCNFTQAE